MGSMKVLDDVEAGGSRTPTPGSAKRIGILLMRGLRRKAAKPALFLGAFLLGPGLMILWTMGNFITNVQRQGSSGTISAGVLFYEGADWKVPSRVYVGASNNASIDLSALVSELEKSPFSSILSLGITTEDSFLSELEDTLERGAEKGVGVFLHSNLSFSVVADTGVGFYDGNSIKPMGASVHFVGEALAKLFGASPLNVSKVQPIPTEVDPEANVAPYPYGPLSGTLLIFNLGFTYAMALVDAGTDYSQGIVRSFQLVGVPRYNYDLSVVLLLLLSAPIFAATFFASTWAWKLWDQSSPILAYVGLLLLFCNMATYMPLFPRLAKKEEDVEKVGGIMFIGSFMSIIIGLPIALVAEDGISIVRPLTLLHPGFGGLALGLTLGDAQTTGGIHGSTDAGYSGLLELFAFQIVATCLSAVLLVASSSGKFWRLFWPGSFRSAKNSASAAAIAAASAERLGNPEIEPLPGSAEVVISVQGVEFSYQPGLPDRVLFGKKPVPVLKGLDMQVCRGEVLGFLGHNGAGKTTTIDVLWGENAPSAGQVQYNFADGSTFTFAGFNSADLTEQVSSAVRQRIGVCPQTNMHAGSETCEQVLTLFAQLKGGIPCALGQSVSAAIKAEVKRRIDDLGFTSKSDLAKPVESFSGGMKRKVSIAIALLGDPEAVFLDEPTAGLDPSNRRTIWDLISAAKKNRSIILTTHFMDEADILSDRVAVLKDGKLKTCGTSLFLKNHFGAGYSLEFSNAAEFDVSKVVPGAKPGPDGDESKSSWTLPYGQERCFSAAIVALDEANASDLSLQLTTLEQVFLATGKEDHQVSDQERTHKQEEEEKEDDDGHASEELLQKIWKDKQGVPPTRRLSHWEKVKAVSWLLFQNWRREPGLMFNSVILPVIYAGGIMTASYFIGKSVPEEELIKTPPVALTPAVFMSGYGTPFDSKQVLFFGLQDELGGPRAQVLLPLVGVDEPTRVQDYFDVSSEASILASYLNTNETLQVTECAFCLPAAAAYLANAALFSAIAPQDPQSIQAQLVNLPYPSDEIFPINQLIIPVGVLYALAGSVYAVLDWLVLKEMKVIALLRSAGIPEFTVGIGVAFYKTLTNASIGIILVIALGIGLERPYMGNAGRWLATLLLMAGFVYSIVPPALLFARTFISDYASAKNWFPFVFFTFLPVPYAGIEAAKLILDSEASAAPLRIAADCLSLVFPFFAMQRGVGSVVAVSSSFNDPNLEWSEVWSFENRVWYDIMALLVSGTAYWALLSRVCRRPSPLKLKKGESHPHPLSVGDDPDLSAARTKSLESADGIGVTDVCKSFRLKKNKRKANNLKHALKGVSVGVEPGEIYALIGPNGSGKTTLCSSIVGDIGPEHGTISLAGNSCSAADKSVDSLFSDGRIAYTPQFDALFRTLTVKEHLEFYAKVRGLDATSPEAKEHVDAIIDMLNLRKHLSKKANALSGGYKRRLSLAVTLVGYPDVMLLDEVTTGIDTGGRHLIWEVLKPQHSFPPLAHSLALPAVLMSTHYMDEATVLGAEIGIMVNGAMITSGTMSRLNELYCNSFYVELIFHLDAPNDAIVRTMDNIESKGEGMKCEIAESSLQRYKIKIPFIKRKRSPINRQLARLFDILETGKDSLLIRFYQIEMSSLEQIFIELSKKQLEADLQAELEM